MKKKINLLIIASILGLIALSVIQGYLINNTYKLKKDKFLRDTKKSISQIDDLSPALDSLSEVWQIHFLDKLTDYKLGTTTRDDVIKGLEFVIDSINDTYIKEYQTELVKNKIPYGIKFHKSIEAIILLDSVKNDTVFDYKKARKTITLGDIIPKENAIDVSTTAWETEHNSSKIINNETKEIFFNLLLKTKDKIDIEDWKSEVFKQMIGLLVLSLLIFLFVFGLLYNSIKSLITQKKISDIKTDFVNNITHELKTPLATLTLATQMLKNPKISEEPQRFNSTINTIERQNKRLQKLIDQVLNNSLGYTEIKLNKESIEIENYLNTILDDFQLATKSENVKVNREFLITKKTIKIDKFYITTAILNILENAVKYSDESCVINFKVESNSNLKIKITDNGIGISEHDQKQIFDKFYRAQNKEIHDVKGLGLGLFYTNQIIKAHNGTITIESEKGKGSTFILVLPIN